jgi:hypothetical protein
MIVIPKRALPNADAFAGLARARKDRSTAVRLNRDISAATNLRDRDN